MAKKPIQLDNLDEVGRRIRQARELRGLKQVDLAGRLGGSGLSQNNLTRYEKGYTEPPAGVLLLLSRELRVSVDWLLTGDGEPDLDARRGAGGLDDVPVGLAKLVAQVRTRADFLEPAALDHLDRLFRNLAGAVEWGGYVELVKLPRRAGRPEPLDYDERQIIDGLIEVLRHPGPAAQAAAKSVRAMLDAYLPLIRPDHGAAGEPRAAGAVHEPLPEDVAAELERLRARVDELEGEAQDRAGPAGEPRAGREQAG